MRADQALVERGLAASRSQAQRLLAAGVRWRVGDGAPWQQVKKNSEDIPQAAHIELLDASEAAFVSRGGLKLHHGQSQRAGVARWLFHQARVATDALSRALKLHIKTASIACLVCASSYYLDSKFAMARG